MDLEAARKSLAPKQGGFSTKKLAFLAVAAVILVGGIAWRASHYLAETADTITPAETAPQPDAAPSSAAAPPAVETAQPVPKTPPAAPETAAAPPPSAPATPAAKTAQPPVPQGEAAGQAAQQDLPGAGMILVSKKPVEVLASPSADAPAMFGFPAGRPFRVIAREGGYAKIKDLRSGASGWIDEAALTAPPPRATVAAPSPSTSGSSGGKPSTAAANPKTKAAAKKGAPAAAPEVAEETGSVQPERRPGLFGKGGLFGGIFGGGNAN